MSSSAAVQSSSPQNPSVSDVDDDDEEIEYEEIEEEIEVEEEIEEEIEVEEEDEFEVEEEDEDEEEEDDDDDDDESAIGEALTPVRQENQINDSNQIPEAEHEEQIKSGPVTSGISVSNQLPDIPITQETVGDCRTSDSREEGQSHVGGERTSRDDDPKVSFDDHTEVNDVKRNCFVDINAALTTREKDNAVKSDVAETDQNVLETVGIIEKINPRLHVPVIRLRESPSSAEFDGENKRQKVACEFHARGWCIKGSSCRFLHTDEESDATVRGEVKREASSSACTPLQHSVVNSKLNVETEKLIIRNDDLLGTALLPAGGESRRQTSYSDNSSHYAVPLVKGSSIDRSGTYHGDQSGYAVASHDNHHNSKSSFEIKLEEMINKKSDILQNDHRSSELSHSHPRHRLSFGLSSWNISGLGTQSHLDKSSLEHCASVSFPLQRSNSPFSFSESQSRNYIFRDTEPAIYKTKMSFGDWEPSVPFRPSHVITRNLLLKESLYDPIHDSIEHTYVRDGRMKFSYSGHGSSVMNLNMPSNSSQGEKLLNPVHVEDAGKDTISSSGYGNRLNFDKPKHTTEPEVDGSGKMDETVPDINIDGHVQSESKAVKYFQAALIEFVKELVKPTWREGLLSKDAHKIIVKKASDKVLSTLEPHQVPSTPESIKLYLSSSQPKLAKLVEAYIDKYGKF